MRQRLIERLHATQRTSLFGFRRALWFSLGWE
jgi:hypothetical protein